MGLFDAFRKKKADPDKEAEATKAAPAKSVPAKPEPAKPVPAKPAEEPYIGEYNPVVNYRMEYVPDSDQYIVEVHDITGALLNDDPLTFFMGSTMYVAVFALTEEEYNLRHAGTPSDNPKLNDLLQPIFTKRPKDRLLMALQVEGDNRRPLTFREQADTVDDFAYPKYRRERLIRYVRSLDKLWMTRAFEGKYPGLDFRGGARVFDSAEKALNDIRSNAALKMSIQTYTPAEFEQEARSWYGLGIPRFLMNPGQQGITGEIPRDSFVPDPVYKAFDIYGSDLTHQILRYAEFRFQLAHGNKDAQAMAMTLWDTICHTLPRIPLLVPVAYEGDPENNIEDSELHMTEGAYEALTRAEIRRQTGKAPAEGKLTAEDADGNPINIAKIELFYGSEGYRFAAGRSGRNMHLRTVNTNGRSMLCAFTGFNFFNTLFRGKARAAVFTFDEIIEHVGKGVSDAPTGPDGLVINPAGVELALDRKDIENVCRIRNEPPKIYSIQQKRE